MKKTIAIIGHGYVGKAMKNFFKDDFNILIFDPANKKYKDTKEEINNNADLAVICVPTPISENGEADLEFVSESFDWLEVELVVIKSTVPPLTTKKLQLKYPEKKICFSPEYIGEGKYKTPVDEKFPDSRDVKKHNFLIIGGESSEIIGEYFRTVMGDSITYKYVDSTTAELCKYMENSFLGTKVTFCNSFYELAGIMDVDYDELRELWLLDGRIGVSHTLVFKDDRGFSGKCLPKDISAIVNFSKKMGYDLDLLKSVLEVNEKFLNKNNIRE